MQLAEQYFQRLLYDTSPIEAVGTLDNLWSTRLTSSGSYFGLAIPEYNVHMCLIYIGEVGNGGHTQFFFNHGGGITLRVQEALRALAVDDLGRILNDACRVFPKGTIPEERQTITEFLSGLSGEALARLDTLDREVDDVILNVDRQLLDYLRVHEQEILLLERGFID